MSSENVATWMGESEKVEPGDARSQPTREPSAYYERRRDLIYLHAARQACQRFVPCPRSVIDVGSNGTPTLEWYRGVASTLTSVDMKRPYLAEGVEGIRADFFEYEPQTNFDLVTCFQVLEHVPDARRFAQKLLKTASVVVVSVPYKWPAGASKHHVHDPVDLAKMYWWFRRHPQFSYVAREVMEGARPRLIHVYFRAVRQIGKERPWYERKLGRLRKALRYHLPGG
jgi:hypothetical protein